MINHTSENIDSLSTTRLFFKSKLIRCKQIAYSVIQYTVFKYFGYYWTYRDFTEIIDRDRKMERHRIYICTVAQ